MQRREKERAIGVDYGALERYQQEWRPRFERDIYGKPYCLEIGNCQRQFHFQWAWKGYSAVEGSRLGRGYFCIQSRRLKRTIATRPLLWGWGWKQLFQSLWKKRR